MWLMTRNQLTFMYLEGDQQANHLLGKKFIAGNNWLCRNPDEIGLENVIEVQISYTHL